MALDNDIDDLDTIENAEALQSNDIGLSNISPDAPDFVKDIKNKSSNIPLDMNVEFIPQNPYTMNGNAVSYQSNQDVEGVKERPPFFETLKAEAYKWNFSAQGAHAGYEKYEQVDPLLDVAPADWNSKTDADKFVNVQPQYLKYLFDATGPKDQAYRLQRVLSEQSVDEALDNGSFLAKIIGGVVGAVTDPMTYIPVTAWAKYAKLAPTLWKSATRAAPGVATYSLLSSAAEQADKANGNMEDFLTDSFTRTVVGTILFAGIGAASHFTDKMALWALRKFGKTYIDGIDYKLATDKEGKITGFNAVNKGGLSADKVSFAQDLANSSFAKSGVFKVPYLGEAASRFLSMPVLGTPLPKLLNSPFKTIRGVLDRVADHSIITKGLEEGEVAPKKFASLMNQEFAQIRSLSAQVDALHLERNGFDIKSRPLGGLVNLGLNLKDKALKVLATDIDKKGYVSRLDFHDEIQEVLRTEVASQHAPVNEAANMMRKQMDSTYAAYRKAYNLPEDWMPPKTAEAYLMRVYDTPYLMVNEGKWIGAISNWLKDADEEISGHLQPIKELEQKIAAHTEKHVALIGRPNIRDVEVKTSSNELLAMRARKKALEEKLQNELRTNPNLQLHVDDWNALSADEAKEIEQLTKRQTIALKEVEERKAIIAGIKKQSSQRASAAIKSKTAKTAKSNTRKSETGKLVLAQEEQKLALVQKEYDEESEKLQQMMHNGEINPRLFVKAPDSFIYHFKDTSKRLRFRDTYESHAHREAHAKAYYDTITNQTPEDTINQVMGRFTGNARENPIKQRTLLVPDEILYKIIS